MPGEVKFLQVLKPKEWDERAPRMGCRSMLSRVVLTTVEQIFRTFATVRMDSGSSGKNMPQIPPGLLITPSWQDFRTNAANRLLLTQKAIQGTPRPAVAVFGSWSQDEPGIPQLHHMPPAQPLGWALSFESKELCRDAGEVSHRCI